MKRIAALVFIAAVSAAAADFRPPVPDVGVAEEKRQILQSCKTTTLVPLPPMVEADYLVCANAYYKPDAPNAAYRLSTIYGKEVKVSAITIAAGFVRAYEINATLGANALRLLCDESVSRCYEVSGVHAIKRD
jgi:hypothetical protein